MAAEKAVTWNWMLPRSGNHEVINDRSLSRTRETVDPWRSARWILMWPDFHTNARIILGNPRRGFVLIMLSPGGKGFCLKEGRIRRRRRSKKVSSSDDSYLFSIHMMFIFDHSDEKKWIGGSKLFLCVVPRVWFPLNKYDNDSQILEYVLASYPRVLDVDTPPHTPTFTFGQF